MFFVFVDLWFFLIKKKNFWRSLGSGFSFSFHCLSGFWIFYNGFLLVIWFICLLCGFVKLIYMLFGMWLSSELVVFSIFSFWDLFQFIFWDSVMISRNWGLMFLFVVVVFLFLWFVGVACVYLFGFGEWNCGLVVFGTIISVAFHFKDLDFNFEENHIIGFILVMFGSLVD